MGCSVGKGPRRLVGFRRTRQLVYGSGFAENVAEPRFLTSCCLVRGRKRGCFLKNSDGYRESEWSDGCEVSRAREKWSTQERSSAVFCWGRCEAFQGGGALQHPISGLDKLIPAKSSFRSIPSLRSPVAQDSASCGYGQGHLEASGHG